MIYLTKKDKEGSRFLLNHKLIEKILPMKDTILLLIDGKKIIVDEKPNEIVDKIIEFESQIILRSRNKKDV